ncbi:MAG TPA: hypothetical protein VL882_19995 [Vicinamibacterales bacterium]|nr:hypothetical protein [Vicinamibacterales bacterium]
MRAQRFAALSIIIAMILGSTAICAGWAGSAEERLACCVEETGCPMHEPPVPHSHTSAGVTQAQADACCAASESRRSSPTTPHFTNIGSASLAASVPSFIMASPTALVPATRSIPARPPGSVPRHLLLSVLIV